MELFHPLQDLWSKNLFYKMSIIFTKEFIIDFQNRKWNYPNRKWNYLSHFEASDQKTSFTKCFSFIPRSSKLIFKIGYGILQTGNGIIYPISMSLIKKIFCKMFLIETKEFKIDFQNRKWNSPKRKWNYLSYIQVSDKNFFLQNVSLKPRSSKLIFKTYVQKLS